MSENLDALLQGLKRGSRNALARSITLIESTRSDHREQAEALFKLLPRSNFNTLRIAISGSPGVGKSSFIENFGLHLINQGKKVAVLAIDPSSPITGGSILGDKTRMEDLAKSEFCFIRPTPSSGHLGGVARNTRESILLCEAAGFDVILIETVGIGQSEVLAASMTDFFAQLHQPMSGDELQGIKKGVMELADLVIVTKADGESENAAKLAKLEIERALSLTRVDHESTPSVFLSSAINKQGYVQIWEAVLALQNSRKSNNSFFLKRASQSRQWLDGELYFALHDYLLRHPEFDKQYQESLRNISQNHAHCATEAKALISKLLVYAKN